MPMPDFYFVSNGDFYKFYRVSYLMLAGMQLDALAFGTHPDDVELFCGGTLLKLIRQGMKTGVVDLTMGELSTRGTVEVREKEAREAASRLQLSSRTNAGLPDGRIENSYGHRLKIITFLRMHRPKLIFIPYWSDRHPDHRNASIVLQEAAFYSGLEKITTGHEPFRPKHVIFYFHHEITDPSFVVDISDTFDEKMNAVRAYRSQFYDAASGERETYISSQAFIESVEIRARYFGFQIGVKYGEPFRTKTVIKIDNLAEVFA